LENFKHNPRFYIKKTYNIYMLQSSRVSYIYIPTHTGSCECTAPTRASALPRNTWTAAEPWTVLMKPGMSPCIRFRCLPRKLFPIMLFFEACSWKLRQSEAVQLQRRVWKMKALEGREFAGLWALQGGVAEAAEI
jgi:hypothetical protein